MPDQPTEQSRQVRLRYPFNALVSYHYFKKSDLTELTAAGLRLIGDSGAFSADTQGAPVDVDQFAEWGLRWRDQLCWLASLDVIGNPDATWANYRRLRDRYGLDVVPTLHAGGDKHLLDRYAADGVDFMGLGGLVVHRGRPLATLPWLVDVMRYARDTHPGMRFHGWGVTNPKLIMALPWYSVDSSSIGQGYRYGRLSLFDPRTGKWMQMAMDGKEPLAHTDLLRTCYGVPARWLLKSTPANRPLVGRVVGKSYQLVEDYLRRRHGAITAPTYGVTDGTPGATVHGASTMPVESLTAAWQTSTAPPGPHVHAADGDHHKLMNLGNHPPAGPHVHAAENPSRNLLNLGRNP